MASKRRRAAPHVSAELSDADLGDERLNRRLVVLAERLSARPSASFPKALDDAELEAAYRFFGNDKVTPEAILAPHVRQTVRRAGAHSQVLVVHDTTQFEFGGETKRPGLGRLIRPGQGFFGHFSLATTADGKREPLGLLSVETIFRLDKARPKAERKRINRGESARWVSGVETAEAQLDGAATAIHIMDREGDSSSVLAALTAARRGFVIRAFRDRVLADGAATKLRTTAAAAKPTFQREVPLSPRPKIPGPKGKRHPPRRMRIARLTFAATTVALPVEGEIVSVHVIHVAERRPPKGQPPVEWFLLTSLPIDTDEQIAFAVDCYRARWTIEEFFKALKTGCAYERRQLESAKSLLNALAILAPVAWRLLLIRHLARSPDDDRMALTPTQLEVLRAVAKRPLPAKLTARDAMLAVAALGGHIKNNGDPGWIVLGRGLHDLLIMEMAWRARGDAEK